MTDDHAPCPVCGHLIDVDDGRPWSALPATVAVGDLAVCIECLAALRVRGLAPMRLTLLEEALPRGVFLQVNLLREQLSMIPAAYRRRR